MAYLTSDDFREGKALWPDLIVPGAVDDDALTAAIAGAEAYFDSLTRDHFSPETSQDLVLYGNGTDMLMTPGKRLTAVAGTVLYYAVDGASSTEVLATQYQVHTWGLQRRDGDVWGVSRRVDINDASYGWPATPYKVKRAVALLTYDSVRGGNKGKLNAVRWSTGDAEFEIDPTSLTGMPEVDRIVRQYRVPNLGLG